MSRLPVPSLRPFPMFADTTDHSLLNFEQRLVFRTVARGEPLMSQGEAADFFAIVLSGDATATRASSDGPVVLANLGAGDIVGELGLLLGRLRAATITAATDIEVLLGDETAFSALLDLAGVHEQIGLQVSRRLAEDTKAIPIGRGAKDLVQLRPLVPGDREPIYAAANAASPQTLYRRFFTPGVPDKRVLDHLVDIDFVDHFAWVCLSEDAVGIGVARYIRDRDDPSSAECAFSVDDNWQGQGIGTLLLGSLATAALSAGIETLTGSVLAENAPMRALFKKAGARSRHSEPGVVEVELSVDAACELISVNDRLALTATVVDIVHAGGLALTGQRQ
ncbi:MAG: GNAT family N-acetyltransferase [Actinomycetia bacterium]|nr:GNAT family N-acetyltransferase [Actinomycetes bacterium]